LFNAENPSRFELPGVDPRTVIVYRPLTQEDDLVMEGLFAEINKGEAAMGRELFDPSAMRKKAKVQRSFLAGRIECVENLQTPGDSVTDKEDIETFLVLLPAEWFEGLKSSMRMGMKMFAGKA
jgi:hypothetical protein